MPRHRTPVLRMPKTRISHYGSRLANVHLISAHVEQLTPHQSADPPTPNSQQGVSNKPNSVFSVDHVTGHITHNVVVPGSMLDQALDSDEPLGLHSEDLQVVGDARRRYTTQHTTDCPRRIAHGASRASHAISRTHRTPIAHDATKIPRPTPPLYPKAPLEPFEEGETYIALMMRLTDHEGHIYGAA